MKISWSRGGFGLSDVISRRLGAFSRFCSTDFGYLSNTSAVTQTVLTYKCYTVDKLYTIICAVTEEQKLANLT